MGSDLFGFLLDQFVDSDPPFANASAFVEFARQYLQQNPPVTVAPGDGFAVQLQNGVVVSLVPPLDVDDRDVTLQIMPVR